MILYNILDINLILCKKFKNIFFIFYMSVWWFVCVSVSVERVYVFVYTHPFVHSSIWMCAFECVCSTLNKKGRNISRLVTSYVFVREWVRLCVCAHVCVYE